MEENKIRIGITQGDINGVGYEVILKTFSDPTMLELCTPIIGTVHYTQTIVSGFGSCIDNAEISLHIQRFTMVGRHFR